MSTKMAYGVFEDEDLVLSAIPKLREQKFKVTDVISPYPIHGLDVVLGLKRTRIAICAFLFGITGTSLALLMMWYMNIFDWPMDIGGKPSFALYKNLPAFIPVTFEPSVSFISPSMNSTLEFGGTSKVVAPKV